MICITVYCCSMGALDVAFDVKLWMKACIHTLFLFTGLRIPCSTVQRLGDGYNGHLD